MARSFSRRPKFTAASCQDAAPVISPFTFSPFTLHRRGHSTVQDSPRRAEKTGKRPRTNSQLQIVHSNVYAGDLHDTMLPGERMPAQQQTGGDVAALVDFLKNHPPPPHNFMSIPYEDAEDEIRGRWSKIKSMTNRRSKSTPKKPHQIRLPDSAVAGVTTDGHRHIAISIPWEAAPFGPEDMRSQYPVFTQDAQVGMPSKDPVRTYKNETGTVIVLRPVSEAYEAGSGASTTEARKPPCPPPSSPTDTQRRLSPPPLPPHKPTSSAGSAPHDYIGVLPTSFESPTLDDRSAPWHTRASSRDEGPAQQDQQRNLQTFQRSAYPARASSMTSSRSARRRNATPSIDSVMQPPESAPSVLAAMPMPMPMPMNNDQEDLVHAAPGTTRCRKAVVRDKKRRDLEAMRHAKVRDQQRDTGTGSESACAASGAGPTLALSNLMVVMDMQPMSGPEPEAKAKPEPPRTSGTRASRASARETKERPISSVTVNKPSLPTPPTSAHGSPPQKHNGPDRISSIRRREWGATREREQKARQAVALAHVKAQRLASGDASCENGAAPRPDTPTDAEVLQLYGSYREHQLRDMERRLRRLERNGDMWLQALMPVLESMHKSWTTADDQALEGVRDWASSDGGDTLPRGTAAGAMSHECADHYLVH